MNTYTLEEVRQKALMLQAEGKKRYLREKVFLSRYYPDMILPLIFPFAP
ncbi:MAG: hypothetical protein F6K39_18625, partial [Okeania sp. SIO3B3]|nr:hypothetical protein [Okeania sp. SIO3B3]